MTAGICKNPLMNWAYRTFPTPPVCYPSLRIFSESGDSSGFADLLSKGNLLHTWKSVSFDYPTVSCETKNFPFIATANCTVSSKNAICDFVSLNQINGQIKSFVHREDFNAEPKFFDVSKKFVEETTSDCYFWRAHCALILVSALAFAECTNKLHGAVKDFFQNKSSDRSKQVARISLWSAGMFASMAAGGYAAIQLAG